jgi:uncharacterized membrane protein YGL010W
MRMWRSWRARHQDSRNFALHALGVPLTVVGVGLWIAGRGWWGTAAFVAGYLLQWFGHLIEGNDVGEVIPIKKLLGKPYIAVAPQYQRRDDPAAGS